MLRRVVTVLAIIIVAVIGLQAPAGAQPVDPVPVQGTSQAQYNGRTIDLSRGWQGAVACNVYSPTRVECFDTMTDANRAAGDLLPPQNHTEGTVVALAEPACPRRTINPDSYWFCLYQNIDYGGQTLRFADEYWQSLHTYNFAWRTSSFYNRQSDGAMLGDGLGGVLHVSSQTRSSNIGPNWNDRAVDVHG